MKKLLFLLLFLPLVAFGQQLNVASYNIRCANRGDDAKGNGWKARCPEVVKLVRNYGFDLFGAQEVVGNQLRDLLARLPEYAYLGVARDDGKDKGEYSPIFYKKASFQPVTSGTFWLAPVDSLPAIGWDAALPRVCTWAQFQRKDGSRFWFFNLHMDHLGKVARLESAKLVLRKIQAFCGSEPVILVGDFNMDQRSDGYALLANSGLLRDSYGSASERHADKPTFNDYDLDAKGDDRIDHLFISRHFDVLRYDILTDSYRSDTTRLPSDHYPVRVLLKQN